GVINTGNQWRTEDPLQKKLQVCETEILELKTRIKREDIKRELLGNRTSLTESHCIRCLQAFKFLVNIKRQCLDCQLYVCRSCSHFNKNEQGWLCDPCHMTR
uniref:FYVE-type zinc finger domain-containing protein n=1 Tax=Oryzias sinensis TaxID=183150 RepID=A0A8C7YBB1_9TELE